MTAATHPELYEQLASVRARVFELLDEVSSVVTEVSANGPGRDTTERLCRAAVGVQSAANELGSVQALFHSPRPGGRFAPQP